MFLFYRHKKKDRKHIWINKQEPSTRRFKCICIDWVFELDRNRHSFVANLVHFVRQQSRLNKKKTSYPWLMKNNNKYLPAFLCKWRAVSSISAHRTFFFFDCKFEEISFDCSSTLIVVLFRRFSIGDDGDWFRRWYKPSRRSK